MLEERRSHLHEQSYGRKKDLKDSTSVISNGLLNAMTLIIALGSKSVGTLSSASLAS